jgi:hypothetical protein
VRNPPLEAAAFLIRIQSMNSAWRWSRTLEPNGVVSGFRGVDTKDVVFLSCVATRTCRGQAIDVAPILPKNINSVCVSETRLQFTSILPSICYGSGSGRDSPVFSIWIGAPLSIVLMAVEELLGDEL